MNELASVGVPVAVVFGFIELVKFLVARIKPPNELGVLTPKQHEAMMMHLRFDDDGAPMWYTPRSWAGTQEKIADTQEKTMAVIQEVSNALQTTAKTLERMEQRIERQKQPT